MAIGSGRNAESEPEEMRSGPLKYAPENELGVVLIFYDWARKHRMRIERIQQGCPDCIALRKAGGRERRIRIEFEYRSATFKQHRHELDDVDWIVCWEDNWPSPPKGLRIVELRGYYGHGFNVWIQPVSGEYRERISRATSSERWSVPSQAKEGDLVLFYHTRPLMAIKDVFKLVDHVQKVKDAGWKEGPDYMGRIRRVCRLRSPLFLEDLRRDRIVGTAGFIRGMMRGRPRATEYWPYIYDMVIARNPSLEMRLKKYAPLQLR